MAISFIGSGGGNAINAGSITASLPGSMEVDDLIIVAYAVGDDDFTQPTLAITTAGYTEITSSTLSSDGGVAGDGNLAVFYKFHNGTDTNVVTTAAGTGTDSSTAVQLHVYRGVDPVNPFAATATTATGTAGGDPNPPSIIFTGAGKTWIVAVGCVGNSAAITLSSPPAGYTAPRASDVGNDTFDTAVQIAYKVSTTTPEDPGIFTDSGAGAAWCAVTIALNALPEQWDHTLQIPNRYVGPPALRRAFREPVWPQSTYTGLIGWYDATQDDVVADGTSLAVWTDRSGRGNDAPQTNALRQPKYYSNIYSGGTKPGILIDATGADPNYFELPNPLRIANATSVYTLMVVWKWFTAPPGGVAARFFIGIDVSGSTRMSFRCDASTPSNAGGSWWNGTSAAHVGTVDDDDADGHIYTRRDGGPNLHQWFDDLANGSQTTLAPYTPDLTGGIRGIIGSSTSEPAKGYLGEVKMWNYGLTDEDIQTEIAALTAKWLTAPTTFPQFLMTLGVGQ